MTRRAFLAAFAAAVLAGPAAARRALRAGLRPGGPRVVAREESLAGGRALADGSRLVAAREVPVFHLLGVQWRGSGEVWARTRAGGGRWGRWWRVEAEIGGEAGGWWMGNPLWAGASDAVQYRVRGRVLRLRAHYVWSPPMQRRLSYSPLRGIITRSGWGADESIVRRPPAVAAKLRLVIVHHTAGADAAVREESAAIVRAIQLYHVHGNGWDDIGYNFLVDRFGQLFEGRAGGMERNVVGAHAAGFNTGSLGVAVIGNYEHDGISAPARSALIRLLAWRLDLAHIDAARLVTVVSAGNERIPKGISITVPAIVGHRELTHTACPGRALAAELASLARAVAESGLPKLYEPSVEGGLPGTVRFWARLSSPRRWRIVIVDGRGQRVAASTGSGAHLDWTWDGRRAGHGSHAWGITAGKRVRPAAGTIPISEAAPAGGVDHAGPRPADVPRRIPTWAWRLHAWHRQPPERRGPRPHAPRHPPSWYWEWHHWRMKAVQARRSELRRQFTRLRREGLAWSDVKASQLWNLYLSLGGS